MPLDAGQLRVLVIEDNAHVRLLIRTVLQTLGVRGIEDARDGSHALEVLQRYPADLVIADWKMDPMDGIAFAERIRRSPDSPNPYLPIIMVTGYGDDHIRREAFDAGVNEFLTKPIAAKALVGAILQIIDEFRPFVRCRTYIGPDRRRQPGNDFTGRNRRAADPVPAA